MFEQPNGIPQAREGKVGGVWIGDHIKTGLSGTFLTDLGFNALRGASMQTKPSFGERGIDMSDSSIYCPFYPCEICA